MTATRVATHADVHLESVAHINLTGSISGNQRRSVGDHNEQTWGLNYMQLPPGSYSLEISMESKLVPRN